MASAQERRGDRNPAHRPCTGLRSSDGLSPLLPQTSRAFENASTSWRKTASDCPFFQVATSANAGPAGKHMSAPGTGDQAAAVPWAQRPRTDMPSAQTSSSVWSTCPWPSRPLVSPSQPGFRLSIQRVGDIGLSTAPLFQTGPALLLRDHS